MAETNPLQQRQTVSGTSPAASSSKNSWNLTKGILFVVALLLGMSVYAHFMGSYIFFTENFTGGASPSVTEMKTLFAAFTGLILVIGLLFTPGKGVKSPLFYVSNQISSAIDSYKATGSDDPDKKKDILVEIVALAIYLAALTASYYFLIKNIVPYDESYAIDTSIGLLTVIFFGVVVIAFIAFSSFIVKKLEEIDANTSNDSAEKQGQKVKFAIIMFVGILLTIGIGNGLSAMAAEKMNANDGMVSTILQYLGGDRTALGGDDAELNIFQ